MKLIKGLNPVVRATGVVSAVVIVAGGVTFAALNDSVVLADSSASTANANLSIWNSTTSAWAKTAPGFNVTDLVPGEDKFSDPQKFYLKNETGAPLYVTAMSNTDFTLTGADDSDVKLRFISNAPNCDDEATTATLAELKAGDVELPCNTLGADAQGNAGVPATEGNYTVEFGVKSIDDDGDAGVALSNLDLTFTGSVTDPSHHED